MNLLTFVSKMEPCWNTYLLLVLVPHSSIEDTVTEIFDDLSSSVIKVLTVFFAELCFPVWSLFWDIVLSGKCQQLSLTILKRGERTECVVAVDSNLIRLLVDLATKWLSSARKHTRNTNSNSQVCEIHPFLGIQGKSIAWLVNSTLNFIRKNDVAQIANSWNLTWNSVARQWIFL